MVGKHAGFCDLFVPIIVAGEAWAYVVTGPFATERPTSTEILRRWLQLTGRQGHPDDPEFSKYLEITLSSLVLEGEQVGAFQALVERLAELIVSTRSSETAHTDEQLLAPELRAVRFVERMWDAARVMLDERTSRVWSTPQMVDQRASLGLHGVPEHVVVGLFVTKERDSDRVDDLLRRHAFQRYCVELARDAGNVLSVKIGDHGVTFLGASTVSRERARRTLVELGERAASIARRRFGLTMHLGVSTLSAPLPAQYQVALAAAESAVTQQPVRRPLRARGHRDELARRAARRARTPNRGSARSPTGALRPFSRGRGHSVGVSARDDAGPLGDRIRAHDRGGRGERRAGPEGATHHRYRPQTRNAGGKHHERAVCRLPARSS